MANLNTTVDNIELKTNRLGSGADLAQMVTWDDEKYPTTALLRDVANNINSRIVTSGSSGAAAVYPVGSIIMTSTDVNPGQEVFNGYLPGRWELVDKAFKQTLVNLTTSDWTVGSVGVADLYYGKMIRDGRTISLQLELKLRQQISGKDIPLGSIKRDTCGITTNAGKFHSSGGYSLAFARDSSNNASFIVCYTLGQDGNFIVREVLSSKGNNNDLTMKTGTIIMIDTIATTQYGDMMPNACDRFYWKRIA